MTFKCNCEYVRLAIGLLSAIISIVVIVFIEGLPQHKEDQHIMNHICLLQIIASVLLLIAAKRLNEWLLLPWLLIAVIFAYVLVYKSLFYWFHIATDVRSSLMLITLLYVTAGFWAYFIYAVSLDFLAMRDKSRRSYYVSYVDKISEI